MIGTVFRSEDVPVEDRFDCWRDMLGRTRSSDMASAHADAFWAECRLMELGPVTVLPMAALPARYRRGPAMVRRSDPELYHLSLLLDGGLGLDQAGRADTFGPGDLHLVDSSHPYDVGPDREGDCRPVRGVGVDFPKALLPLPADRVHALLGRALPAADGIGALLRDCLTGLDRQADFLRPSDAPRLGTVVLDLVAALVAHVLEAETALPPESRRQVMFRRISAFIRRNLQDPRLTPPAVAAAHHISLSQLHRIFQLEAHGETVAAFIRARRLEGAGRDLADSRTSAEPVHVVAARWGFPRAPEFTRAFRTAYGCSPTEHRMRALSERRGPTPVEPTATTEPPRGPVP
ncbi:helix-turn-helix domain-containing protein [Streptomyces sp. NPDC019539]|uniref:AraC-like ligand-binding domain-containing protein n=1 Tax=Streptomyces sp. NPDC019539 TaxID=3365063 RepID=UPI00378E00E1